MHLHCHRRFHNDDFVLLFLNRLLIRLSAILDLNQGFVRLLHLHYLVITGSSTFAKGSCIERRTIRYVAKGTCLNTPSAPFLLLRPHFVPVVVAAGASGHLSLLRQGAFVGDLTLK